MVSTACKATNCVVAARRAQVNRGFIGDDRFGVRPAAGIATLGTLSLRQQFVDQTIPQIEYLGLDFPDDGIKWNAERGHYDFTDPDWSELLNVIKGNGPCNIDRMTARREAVASIGCPIA